jgi:hypothetical protein
MITPLLIITARLSTNDAASVSAQMSSEQVARLVETPSLFWVVIALGIALSPFMARPVAGHADKKAQAYFYATSAILFFSSVMAFVHIRDRFVLIFADLLRPAYGVLTFPLLLGSSPLGAALLIFAWYYVHPVPRLKAGPRSTGASILRAFIPMVLMFLFISFTVMVGIFMRLI